MSAGIDTQILIWGLQKPHRKGKATKQNVAEMQRRAKILLKSLSYENETVIVSTVTIGELLCGIDKKDHGSVAAEINSRFFCPPFDLRACSFAAELWQFHETWPKDKQIQDRRLLRADTMIVATAKAPGASRFFSHDANCRAFAKEAGMLPFDLPTHAENFLIDQEIDEEEKQK